MLCTKPSVNHWSSDMTFYFSQDINQMMADHSPSQSVAILVYSQGCMKIIVVSQLNKIIYNQGGSAILETTWGSFFKSSRPQQALPPTTSLLPNKVCFFHPFGRNFRLHSWAVNFSQLWNKSLFPLPMCISTITHPLVLHLGHNTLVEEPPCSPPLWHTSCVGNHWPSTYSSLTWLRPMAHCPNSAPVLFDALHIPTWMGPFCWIPLDIWYHWL